MDTFVGLDLGQLVDYSAAAVVRRSLFIDPVSGLPQRSSRGRYCYRFDIAAIRRYPLGTSYSAVLTHIVDQLKRPELGPRPKLVVDGTGVGVAVVEMFRRALRPYGGLIEDHSITITAGRVVSKVGVRDWHVAKIQLVGAIREALESGRLKVPPGLEHADTLKRELMDFQVRITESANEVFSAREGAHDDLVLATALPIWLASHPTMEMATIDPESAAFLRAREHYAIKRENESEVERIEREERDAIAKEQFGALEQADDWKRRRAEQTVADSDDDGIWDSPGPGMPGGGLNEAIPGWYNPVIAQADYNPAVPRVPGPEYRVQDMFRNVDEFRKSQGGS